MTAWTPKLEKLIRKFAAYQERQLQDALNPRAVAVASALRIAFRGQAYGNFIYKKICAEMGLDISSFETNIQQMINLSAQNASDAADKLKKALPVCQQIAKDVLDHPEDGFFKTIKRVKQKNTPY